MGGCKQDNMSHTRLLFDYFCDCFLRNISKIFLKKSLKIIHLKKIKIHIVLLRFMLKIGKKCHFQKISNPFASPFIVKHCNVFVNFLVIGLILINSHVPMIY
jgi:hypothetical protein